MRYEETMQSSGLRLMGRKLLVSLAMEASSVGKDYHSMKTTIC